jgi:hypothetical protein
MLPAKPKFHHAAQKTDPRDVMAQITYIYLEYHSVCPLVRIGTPSPADECIPPEPKRGGGTHSSGREGVGGPNLDDGRKSLVLSPLFGLWPWT